jgi:hypothetical protein
MGNMAPQDIDLEELYAGKRIRGQDVDEPLILTIAGAIVEEFKDGSKKVALVFQEDDRTASVGKQNKDRLQAAFGPRTSLWAGRQVILTQGQIYQGSPSLVISPYGVRRQNGAAPAAGAAAPAPRRVAAPAPVWDDVQEEEIPF